MKKSKLYTQISLFVNVVVLVIFIFGMPNIHEAQSNMFNITYSIFIFACVIIYLISSTKLYRNSVKYDLFFLLGFCIVHFQIPVIFSLGFTNLYTDFVILNKNLMNYLTWFSGVSILFWMIGSQLVSFYLFGRKIKPQIKEIKKIIIRQPIADIFLIIVFLGFVIVAGKPLLSGVYDGGQSWGANATYFYMLLRAFLIVRIFYFFYINNDTPSIQVLFFRFLNEKTLFFITVSYILLFFIGGQRSSILELLILIVCCFSVYIKKIPFFIILIGLVVGGFIFTLLGMGRTANSSELKGNILSRGFEAFESKNESISLPTDELSGSNKITYIAFEYFPSEINYLYGKTMLVDILGVIPFSGKLLLGDSRALDSTSTLLFTYLDQGTHSSYGAGSEVLADVYINWGVIGTFITFFVFGGFISFLQFKFHITKEFYWSLIAAAIIISALFINRAQLLSPLKDIFYVLIFVKIFFKEIKFKIVK